MFPDLEQQEAELAELGDTRVPIAPPVRTGEPIGVQLMHVEPMFAGSPFRVLLDFESPSDLAFIADHPTVTMDPQVAHTGRASLQVPAKSSGFKGPNPPDCFDTLRATDTSSFCQPLIAFLIASAT